MSCPRFLLALGLVSGVCLAAAPLKIACVGDSITEGALLSNPAIESYPARLQRLLGTNHSVGNYGLGGRTLLKRGDAPYWNEPYFVQSHDWQPDIVILKLGTNDAKPLNWRYGTNFVVELEEMVTSYTRLTSAPRVLVCTPCPVFGNGAYGISPGTVATHIAPAIREVAARLGIELIDFHSRMAGHGEWFPDTVHPNSEGAAVMAAIVFQALAGGHSATPPVSLEVVRLSHPHILLQWPAAWAGLVVQAATDLRGADTGWAVVAEVPVNDGMRVRQTHTVAGPARVFRLWQP